MGTSVQLRVFPSDCPPAQAMDHIGPICRLIEADTPASADFINHIVLYPKRKWKAHELCSAHGLSVTLNVEDAKRIRRRVGRLGNCRIAVGILDGTQGKVAQTGVHTEHHTWWPEDTTQFLEVFASSEVIP